MSESNIWHKKHCFFAVMNKFMVDKVSSKLILNTDATQFTVEYYSNQKYEFHGFAKFHGFADYWDCTIKTLTIYKYK